MTESAAPAIVFVEHVLWTPGEDWHEAITHLAGRFARATPLDAPAVLGAGALHEQLVVLNTWASSASVDLDRELGRWLDEHLSMHLRPRPETTRAVRALAAVGSVHAASALPARAAEAIARHAGCWRSIETLHDGLLDAAAVGTVVDSLHPRLIVAAPPTPLPTDVDAQPLLGASA